MIVVFPFSVVDQELALMNAQWMNELGGCKGHDCLAIYDFRCNEKLTEEILTELKKCFSNGSTVKAEAEIDGWPQGANYFMRLAACKLQNSKYPYFLWMEPDAIPMKEGWLEAIDNEFKTVAMPRKKGFMGDRVEVENTPLHMSGVGIYSNPLHAWAGEAYRASEEAWDVAARHQIVPLAHFTKLIEHAWRHPTFHQESELQTQIRPEAVLFHSSKDGSLIDLLLSKRAGKQLPSSKPLEPPKEREEPRSPCPTNLTAALVLAEPESRHVLSPPLAGEARESTTELGRLPAISKDIDSRGGGQDFTCDIFIRTYPGDYPWLKYCLESIDQFCTGFRKVWIVSTGEAPLKPPTKMIEWKVMNDETQDGYLAQQITKLYADVITDYQADYILHVDSDVIFTRSTTPDDFFNLRKPIWYHTPYTEIEVPWQPITGRFMKRQVDHEFMRRFPIIIPRWLYPRVREFCNKTHGVTITDYVRSQPERSFSEFNALGAYAWEFHGDKFTWWNTIEQPDLPEPFARQFHSWGGITPEVEKEIQAIFNRGTDPEESSGDREPSAEGGCGSLNTPIEKPGNGASVASSPDAPPHSGIKELPNGIWVIEGDSHISKWIEQQGRLDHDQNLLPFILPEIGESDVVVDAGAFVGDHTVAYMKAAKNGVVYAFEPNPIAFRCLLHNVQSTKGSEYRVVFDRGLSDVEGRAGFHLTENNHGGCYLKDEGGVGGVNVVRLDTFGLNPNFVKLDVEGFELKALQGMERTIRRCHPKLVIEINRIALDRQDAEAKDIFRFLEHHGYELKILQENCSYDSPMYDILAIHKPIEIQPETKEYDVAWQVRRLRKYADESRGNSVRVGQQLSKAGFK